MESSCVNNENVANAFEALIEITNIEYKKNNINLKNARRRNNNSGCC